MFKNTTLAGGAADWALSISDEMSDVWDAMIVQDKHTWLLWTATRPDVFPAPTLRRLACRFVRETPLHDGRTVWDLLADERSRKAIEAAERYTDGKATEAELDAACIAAYDAACAAGDVAYDATYSAACAAAAAADDAAYDAAYAAARVAAEAVYYAADAATAARAIAYAAQAKMVAELENPFKKGGSKVIVLILSASTARGGGGPPQDENRNPL